MKKLLIFPVIAPDKNKPGVGYEVARDFKAT